MPFSREGSPTGPPESYESSHTNRLTPSQAREWILENQAGRPVFDKLREQGREHPIEDVGRRLREMMSWIRESKKDSSER
ncbi:ketol-acid reductoisomerase [Cystobacter fuscus]|uniref:Ketol-acid reductoisomerase n=1 Tax=Cystobacter fuscus TaxID=43 RepID=A0A250JBI2_9BACT|nr:ketol-acid reductoisomerase [Cystobacter fuscus]